MRLLVFQHLDCEHPAHLRTFLKRDGIEWHAVELDEGEPIPELENYDALWVMGGPMDVWDVVDHPWMIEEKRAIRHFVTDLKRPFLGLCLGHQLLADALGGTCGPQKPSEIGVMEIELTDEGVKDPLMQGVPRKQKVLQWHSVAVAQPPEGATVLAQSTDCPVQALRIGDHAWSMQYHIEVEPDTVDNWAAIPAYRAALEATLGPTGLDKIRSDATDTMDDFLSVSEKIYENFMAAAKTA